jgi:hypothetical protein
VDEEELRIYAFANTTQGESLGGWSVAQSGTALVLTFLLVWVLTR